MFKKILFKLFIGLFPQSLILTGSLLLSFALKLVNIQSLSEQEDGIVNGGISINSVGMNIPVQNDTLFWWGFILFLVGSALELIRIIYNTIKTVKAEQAEKAQQTQITSLSKKILSESKKSTKTPKKA